jgi:hypothetical protein
MVAVRNTAVAGTGSIIGCLDTPQLVGSSAVAGTKGPCPTAVPRSGTYTFPVVLGTDFSLTQTAGNIVECLLSTATCGNLVPYSDTVGSTVLGCISNLGVEPCPAFTNTWLADSGAFNFELYGQTSSTDATAKMDACVKTPGSNACPVGYTVPVSAALLSDTTPNPTPTGCLAANTACPLPSAAADQRYPWIDANKKVIACRAASDCPANFIALCDAETGTILSTGLCSNGGADTRGCVAPGAAPVATPWEVCSQLTSSGSLTKYPSAIGVASQYKFTVTIDTGGAGTVLSCGIHAAAATACNAPTSFTFEAYPAGATIGGTGFRGCTDNSLPSCNTWWRGPSGANNSNAQCAT